MLWEKIAHLAWAVRGVSGQRGTPGGSGCVAAFLKKFVMNSSLSTRVPATTMPSTLC